MDGVNKFKAIAFVGGGGDRPIGHLVLNQYKDYVQALEKETDSIPVRYFQHFQRISLGHFIRKYEGDVCIVSHSWGANSSMRVIASGNRVKKLVTLDPVGINRPDLSRVKKNTGEWSNYFASGPHTSLRSLMANTAAFIGRPYGNLPKGFASRHVNDNKCNHITVCYKYCRPDA